MATKGSWKVYNSALSFLLLGLSRCTPTKAQRKSMRKWSFLSPVLIRKISFVVEWVKFSQYLSVIPLQPYVPESNRTNLSTAMCRNMVVLWRLQAGRSEKKESQGYIKGWLPTWWEEYLRKAYTSIFTRFSRSVCLEGVKLVTDCWF